MIDKALPLDRRKKTGKRKRLNVVAPIGVIVAMAIVCIIFAVLTSARQADMAELKQEEELLSKSLEHRADLVLREVESVVTVDRNARDIAAGGNSSAVYEHVEARLRKYFGHDFVFVVDSQDRVVHGALAHAGDSNESLQTARLDLRPIVDFMRGRLISDTNGAILAAKPGDLIDRRARKNGVLMHSAMGLPAIVAAVAALPAEQTVISPDAPPPVVVSVKFIDDLELAMIGDRIKIRNLHRVTGPQASADDHQFTVRDERGKSIGRFVWTPSKPGAEIFQSVLPYIAVALGGFAILAVFVLRNMRRAAGRIAAGENHLRHLALHDPLCGLPNRISFGERLDQAIEELRRNGSTAAVFYIDLDNFKEVNDTLGHDIGDALIREVTARLNQTTRTEDLVARLGGDEFAVISATACDADSLHWIAGRIIESIGAPYSVNGQDIVIGASIGIAAIDNPTSAPADILRYADMALYRAKSEGRNRACIYDSDMNSDLMLRKRLENDLRRAIEANELSVAYQPLMSQDGRMMIGVEALARWEHPELGTISPNRFIPIAEHSGLINDFGEWVLRRACTEGKAWPGIVLSVNVSPMQFRRLDFPEMVERILADTGFDPKRLELEITESTLLGKIDTTGEAMLRLKSLGIRLALDDFGTGYASLHYLRHFPFDRLKIDRSFVQNVENGPDAAAIVNAVVGLGRGLGMKITAEGVETTGQHVLLRAAGVDTMQGYHFGRPSTAHDILDFVAANKHATDAEPDAKAPAGQAA